jgi:hypothetical protein
MTNPYIPQNEGAHGRAEELQWARLCASGEPVKGMIVIFLQKMCAAFHEFEPAYQAGGLNERALPFFRRRLAGRVGSVLAAMDKNGLGGLEGYAALARLKQAAESAASLAELASLAEPVHQANHAVTDALEK